MANIITNFGEFINEEYKLPTTYKFSSAKSEKDDKEHDRLASKEKDGHKWSKSVKKHGDKSKTENLKCKCGYTKKVENDENKAVIITYTK